MIFKDTRYTNVTVNIDDGVTTFATRRTPNFTTVGCPTHTVIQGETLDLIANKYYSNPRYWWVLLDANIDKVGDYFNIAPGTKLVIPRISEVKEVLRNV